MKTTNFLKPYITFFLLTIFFVHASAQSVSIKGVVREEIPVKEGKITVYLPDDIMAGETISGTVLAEPKGRNEKEIKRNSEALGKYKLDAGAINTIVAGGSGKTFTLSPSSSLTIRLLDDNNNAVATRQVTVLNNKAMVAKNISLASHALTGSPLIIHGPFDGDASNTKCRLDGKEMEILAESPRQTICSMPQTSSGLHTVTIEENGQTSEKKVSAVNMDMTAARTNLRRGQGTTIVINISGLEGIKEPCTLNIANTSPSVINMEGGNTQEIVINPSAVNNGVYNRNFPVTSISDGNFTVNANLQLPDAEEGKTNTATSGTALLCNCYINQQSFLLPLAICNSLGGSTELSAQGPGTESPQTTSGTVYPVITVNVPAIAKVSDNTIRLQVIDVSNHVAAVLFSEKPVSGNNWNPVGAATKEGNSWNYDWTAPVGNDGEHIIRARIADKNNMVTERFTQILLQVTPYSLSPMPGEKINLTIKDQQIKDADQKTKRIADSLRRLQEKLDAWQKKYNELRRKQAENTTMAQELAVIDKMIDKVPGTYRDSLKALIDSLNNLKKNLPAKVDPAALQKAADDAAQRLKDCQDRLNKLKQEKEQAQKDLDALNNQIENLLDKMDQLHLGNNWIGGHGYHSDGSFWYGYVGDENSNTNIDAESNAISNQLRGLKGPQNAANKRVKALNTEIADAEAECDKLKKELDKANEAVKNGNQQAAVETQIDELCRQIEDLMSALKKWCAAHPGVCNFDPELSANPTTPAELQDYMAKLDDIIKKKQQKEKDLENEATANDAAADATGEDINNGEGDKEKLEGEQAKAQAAADQLRAEREKELEAARAAQRKKEAEDNARTNTPKPMPTLPEPVNPSDKQIKFQALSLLRGLYQDYWIKNGPCDCITKALALANNTNKAATDIIGGMAVGVIFAPLEAFPGLSFATKLGLGVAKAIGSALFGGETFSDELAKNLFNVIGGEIFPKLVGDEFTGNRLNDLAGKGLEEIMKEEGIRTDSWEGETELRGCGKVKGKTTTLFNPNTGWVVMMIKIDNCPLIVIKYKVNKDGVPITKPTVEKVNG